jgi:hypothetical protein
MVGASDPQARAAMPCHETDLKPTRAEIWFHARRLRAITGQRIHTEEGPYGMSLKRGLVLLAGSAALAAGSLLPAASAAAAPSAVGPGSCYVWDNEANMPGACADQYTNFIESGVDIWNDPYRPTTVLGSGENRQTFATMEFVSDGAVSLCESGVTTRFWYRGDYKGHGVVGWVPDCYLNGQPT